MRWPSQGSTSELEMLQLLLGLSCGHRSLSKELEVEERNQTAEDSHQTHNPQHTYHMSSSSRLSIPSFPSSAKWRKASCDVCRPKDFLHHSLTASVSNDDKRGKMIPKRAQLAGGQLAPRHVGGSLSLPHPDSPPLLFCRQLPGREEKLLDIKRSIFLTVRGPALI